jgi:hypothetical protein
MPPVAPPAAAPGQRGSQPTGGHHRPDARDGQEAEASKEAHSTTCYSSHAAASGRTFCTVISAVEVTIGRPS